MDDQDKGSRRIYITREISRNEEDLKDTRKFYWWSIRRGEEEFVLGQGPRMDFDPLLNYAIDEVLTKAQFLSPLLYQIHCIGPVGFGFVHIYSERHPPNWNPTVYYYNNTIITNYFTTFL